MARDLVKAVAFIHANNIVHIDIKPGNVLISNLHYTTGTMQEAIISCPILCKLGDLGEARSKIFQTRNIQQKWLIEAASHFRHLKRWWMR